VGPDPELARRFEDEHFAAFREEPVITFEYIVRENRSLLELISADYLFVNDRTIRHYGLQDQVNRQGVIQQLVRRDLPEGSVRGGIVTMAGVLGVTSYPDRTSPVLRGTWILENLLGTPPPEPPPGIEPLSSDPQEVAGRSIRERLEVHRQDPNCASCHDRIDPLGYALENFDLLGRWRDEDGEHAIDASGRLPSGREFVGPRELKEVLLEQRELFIRNLTSKMLGYALGRGLVDSDYCLVDEIVERLEEDDYRAHTLIRGIVTSEPFRDRWDPPQTDEQEAP
jgi:hypothetical protein